MCNLQRLNKVPFPQQQVRSFTREGISQLNPNQYGVYGIFNQTQWIYIGKGDIRQRLLDHLNGDNPRLLQFRPTSFVGEVSANADQREKELCRELNPLCNQRLV